MKVSRINISRFGPRFDAEYYRRSFLEAEDTLGNLEKVEKLKNISSSSITTSAFYSSISQKYSESGIPFLRVSDIKNFSISKEDLVYLPPKVVRNSNSIRTVNSGDILISKGGTLANVAMVPEELGECGICRDIIAIPFQDTDDYLGEYVVAFLNSKYGRLQTMREKSQQVQAHLTLDAIREVKIPKFSMKFQEKVKNWIDEAYEKRRKGEKLLETAESKLLDILDISINSKEKQIYKTNFSRFEEAQRLDAEYYQPKYEKLVKSLKESKFVVRTFGDSKEFFEISSEKIDPSEKPSKDFKYLTISCVNSHNGNIVEHENIKGYQAPSRARMRIKESDVLFPYLSGSSDAVTTVPQEYDGEVASTGFYILRPKGILPGYLFLAMRSKVIQLQFEQKTSGAIMTSINKGDFEDLLMPILPKSYQEKLSQKVSKSFELLEESRSLIDEAKSKVEEKIEEKS